MQAKQTRMPSKGQALERALYFIVGSVFINFQQAIVAALLKPQTNGG